MTILTQHRKAKAQTLAQQLAAGTFTNLNDWLEETSGHRQRSQELRALDPFQLRNLFYRCGAPAFGRALIELDKETRHFVLDRLREAQLAELLQQLQLHDRRDMLALLDEHTVASLLAGVSEPEQQALRELLAWPEDSIGAAMHPQLLTFGEDVTVAEMLQRLRAVELREELGTELYLLAPDGTCSAKLDYRQLLGAEPHTMARDIATTRVLLIPALLPDEDAAKHLLDSGEATAPVVHEGRLIGLLTTERAHPILQEEAGEDAAKQAATTAPAANYRQAGIWLMYRSRVLWLVLLVFGNLFSGAGIAYYEELIEQMVVLVFFLPLLIDSGGNAGSQSATLMVRALATGDVGFGDWWRMIRREIAVALLLGASMAGAVSVLGWFRGGGQVALVVAATMLLVVLVGSIIGMLLPLALTKAKLDPATASAPLITSICDGVGVLIYFGVASAFLL